ncbi:MAG: 50S ribosomal protein L2 [Patescibacteria group bacterium]|nr:50S ribosomal protein L2 [Patescibacteria group bacterium]MCX7589900.1 50S ribosomal protein L2 [Patescibacteria group bacterium]MDW8279580.1 50S ribosomal protein L2 [bacterium]
MAIKIKKPKTPGQRGMTVIDYSVLSKVEPEKSLLIDLKKNSGRNNQGRITTRHKGGGHKKLYRLIDFKQNKMDMEATIETLEYDPYRTAFIAKIKYLDGSRCYILAPEGLKVGDKIITSANAPLKIGNRLKLKNIPAGYQVHNIEVVPNSGGKIVRSAGSYAEVLGTDEKGNYTILKMPSGEIRKIHAECFATLGQVSNPDNNLVVIGKAGRSRHMGIRPTVRGSAMNPVDHPYGGGEGRAQRGTRRPKTLWGKVTGGRKTRNKRKKSNKLILQRRKK